GSDQYLIFCHPPRMTEKFSLEQIRQFWVRQAIKHGQSPAASWSDSAAIDLEIREIVKRLDDGDRVLDIGCANGYSTVALASQKEVSIRGLDYVSEMIDQARARLSGLKDNLLGSVEFAEGDITALKEPPDSYDK